MPDTKSKKPQSIAELPYDVTRAPWPKGPPRAWARSKDPVQRRRWRWFWINEPVLGTGKLIMHHVMRFVPVSLASAVGTTLSRLSQRLYADAPFGRNVVAYPQKLVPEWDTAKARAVTDGWWRNTGRVYAEFAAVNRMGRRMARRADVRDRLLALERAHENILFVSIHVGSWETIFATLDGVYDRPVVGPYQPEVSRFSNLIVEGARRRRGQYVFPPGQKSAILLSRFLRDRSAIGCFFIDEVDAGASHFPLFGRNVPMKTNAARAIKFARRAGAVIVPVALPRQSGARFDLRIFDPIEVSQDADEKAEIEAVIHKLNAIYEPFVVEHMNQWFMLPNAHPRKS